ncbi:MAG: stage II sporulation protein R [Clostridia bacterium]|nr:stage II sporulation protein R [Clostridia bacterium]
MHTKANKRRGALILTSILLLGILTVLGAIYLPVHGEAQIYDAVIRLHVLANSDSEQDQALKMQVRDAVLAVTAPALEECADRAQAKERLTALIPVLTEVAEQTLRHEGCDDSVSILLGEEEYPTRNYESFCFPSGEYLSLRVMIGQAEGQNFWCVLFPPLCMSAATVDREQAEDEFIAVGLSKNQYAIITETENTKYKLRFKFLETLQGWLR